MATIMIVVNVEWTFDQESLEFSSKVWLHPEVLLGTAPASRPSVVVDLLWSSH
jgi:hypothetical protein